VGEEAFSPMVETRQGQGETGEVLRSFGGASEEKDEGKTVSVREVGAEQRQFASKNVVD